MCMMWAIPIHPMCCYCGVGVNKRSGFIIKRYTSHKYPIFNLHKKSRFNVEYRINQPFQIEFTKPTPVEVSPKQTIQFSHQIISFHMDTHLFSSLAFSKQTLTSSVLLLSYKSKEFLEYFQYACLIELHRQNRTLPLFYTLNTYKAFFLHRVQDSSIVRIEGILFLAF